MYIFCKELYKNPGLAHHKAQIFHSKNNHKPMRHIISHGVLCAVYIRQNKMIPACEQVYLGICAPFASLYRKYRK
jgi:hypothetical protein